MRVYLASWFNSRDEIGVRADQLRSDGIEVTSRWLEESISPNSSTEDISAAYLREAAKMDVEDILLATTVVLNVPSAEELKNPDMPIASWARGGRHFEAGFQYATMVFYKWLPARLQVLGTRSLVLVGRKENVFHYLDGIIEAYADGYPLPEIVTFESWDLTRQHLIEESKRHVGA